MITYDTWGAHLPEVLRATTSIGAENFLKILDNWGGPTAREDWNKLAEALRPRSSGVGTSLDGGAWGRWHTATLGLQYPKAFLNVPGVGADHRAAGFGLARARQVPEELPRSHRLLTAGPAFGGR